MSSAGGFVIDVSYPYPVWITITYGNQQIQIIKHTELFDLEYAIKRAIVEARDKLPDSHKHEMDRP